VDEEEVKDELDDELEDELELDDTDEPELMLAA
jgi:hypothetical protein